MKFSIDTLGCKINQSESDHIVRELLARGLKLVSWKERPDVCIINTCTVTARSDSKVRQLIRRVKSRNENSKIIVTGCFVKYNRKFLKDSNINLILNNKNKYKIPGLTIKAGIKKRALENFHSGDHSRPLVKIQDGCEQRCSYCIVPYVRGKYRSVPYGKILNRIKNLQEIGFDEIVLTGIHIGKYGKDHGSGRPENGNKPHNLEGVLEGIIRDTGIRRIRITSIEVNEMSDRLLDIIRKNKERFARHLHIPLQSGSDRVLKLMSRPYDSGEYFKKARTISKALEGIALTTDVMVGFPGENEEDFRRTLDLVKKIAFSKIHVFKFSKRKLTPTYRMNGQVSEETKSLRSNILRDIGDRLRNNYIENNVGKALDVVSEEITNGGSIIKGTSGNYIKVYFSRGKKDFHTVKGKLLRIKADSRYKDGLWGILNSNKG